MIILFLAISGVVLYLVYQECSCGFWPFVEAVFLVIIFLYALGAWA